MNVNVSFDYQQLDLAADRLDQLALDARALTECLDGFMSLSPNTFALLLNTCSWTVDGTLANRSSSLV